MSNENRLKWENALLKVSVELEEAMTEAAKAKVQRDGEFVTVAALRDLIIASVVLAEPTYCDKVLVKQLRHGLRVLKMTERANRKQAMAAAKASTEAYGEGVK